MLSTEQLLEIIKLAQSGNERTQNLAMSALWSNFQPWVKRRIQQYDSLHSQDVISACNQAILEAVSTYEFGLSPFISWLGWKFLAAIKPHCHFYKKETPQFESIHLNDEINLSAEYNLYLFDPDQDEVNSIPQLGHYVDPEVDSIAVQKLRKNLNLLPDEYKEMIRLRFWEEKTYSEIGQHFHITERQSRHQISKNIAILRRGISD